jgi:hypothetical protein
MTQKPLLLLLGASLLMLNQANATVQTVGTGSAVGTVDRSANFNSLFTGADLSAYTEGGLSVTTPGYAYLWFDPFNGAGDGSAFHYASGGNFDWVTIKTTDGARILGVEFLYGNGWWGYNFATVDWRTYNGATLSSSGSTIEPAGTVLGFSDPSGFDSLLVRATYSGVGDYQAIALDDLKVDLTGGHLPESGQYLGAVFAAVCIGLGTLRRRLQRA